MLTTLAVDLYVARLANTSSIQLSLLMLAISCKFSAPVITVATTAKPMSVEELISVSALGCELRLSWFVLSPLDLAIVCARFWLWADSLVLASCSLIFI